MHNKQQWVHSFQEKTERQPYAQISNLREKSRYKFHQATKWKAKKLLYVEQKSTTANETD